MKTIEFIFWIHGSVHSKFFDTFKDVIKWGNEAENRGDIASSHIAFSGLEVMSRDMVHRAQHAWEWSKTHDKELTTMREWQTWCAWFKARRHLEAVQE